MSVNIYQHCETVVNFPKTWVSATHTNASRREADFCTPCCFSLYFSPLFPGSSRAAPRSCQLPSMWCPSTPCAGDATRGIRLPWRTEPTSRVRRRAQPQRGQQQWSGGGSADHEPTPFPYQCQFFILNNLQSCGPAILQKKRFKKVQY